MGCSKYDFNPSQMVRDPTRQGDILDLFLTTNHTLVPGHHKRGQRGPAFAMPLCASVHVPCGHLLGKG